MLFSRLINTKHPSAISNIKKMVENGATLLDVRSPQEYQMGHLSRAINEPLQTLTDKMDDLRKLQEPIIAYCRSGARSGIATKLLKESGIEIYNGGGINELKERLE